MVTSRLTSLRLPLFALALRKKSLPRHFFHLYLFGACCATMSAAETLHPFLSGNTSPIPKNGCSVNRGNALSFKSEVTLPMFFYSENLLLGLAVCAMCRFLTHSNRIRELSPILRSESCVFASFSFVSDTACQLLWLTLLAYSAEFKRACLSGK